MILRIEPTANGWIVMPYQSPDRMGITSGTEVYVFNSFEEMVAHIKEVAPKLGGGKGK